MVYGFAAPQELCKKYDLPGATIAHIDEGQIRYICIGNANENKKVNPETLFQLASVSKTFFSVAMLRWSLANNVSLDAPISSLDIDDMMWGMDKNWGQITIRELLSHSSGLNETYYPGYLNNNHPSLFESLQGISFNHTQLKYSQERRGEFNYSGGGYSLLQFVIERALGIGYEKFMRVSLLDAWELNHCLTEYQSDLASSYAAPHNLFGRSIPTRSYVEKAAAGMYSSISDAALFVERLLHSDNSFLLESMRNNSKEGYGLGIEIEQLNHEIDLYYHFGANIGWRTGIFFIPQLNKGFVVLTNGEGGYPFICDLVEKWLNELRLDQPSFIRDKKGKERIVFLLAILLTVFGGFRGFWMLVQVLKRKRYAFISKKRLFLLISMGVLTIIWYFIFFTPYFPPFEWIIAAFMPFRFVELSQILLMCTLVECMYLVTKYRPQPRRLL